MAKGKVAEGWHEVRNHKLGKEKIGSLKREDRRVVQGEEFNTTTFFVTEFDDKWQARDLYHGFKELGDIDEVFIPNKKSRCGKKYSFVRFFNVGDARSLERKLDNMFLDG